MSITHMTGLGDRAPNRERFATLFPCSGTPGTAMLRTGLHGHVRPATTCTGVSTETPSWRLFPLQVG
jgi:hypothetical protein